MSIARSAPIRTTPHEELDVTTDDLVRRARHPKVVAIGEAGLDYHYDISPREAQEHGFRTHIAAARETGLPLVIHSRDADDDMARILEEETGKGAFPGGAALLSPAGPSSPRARSRSACRSRSPASSPSRNRTTCAPSPKPAGRPHPGRDRRAYLAPGHFRGKRNEPAYVAETAKVLAEMRGV